ncbi:MAG: PIN domain-containing protein, partial [Desulforhabdus sp.]|nr:PIN domain-containing protein [Desulforhabdus sp.]
MPKTYVLDTNVLLHNPQAVFAFEDNEVVIPFAVIEEIDNQKRRQDEIGRNARMISRQLDDLRTQGQLSQAITLRGGGTLRIEMNHQNAIDFPRGLDPQKCDNRILAVAHNIQQRNGGRVVLVTKDLNLRIKADVLGLAAEDFYNDKVDYHELHKGFREVQVSAEKLDAFYRQRALGWDHDPEPFPHEFLILRNSTNPSQSALAHYANKALRPLLHEEAVSWGVRARNKEQKFAMELLLDDSVQVVTLVGSAGTGKTLLALAVGLEKVIEQSAYSRF